MSTKVNSSHIWSLAKEEPFGLHCTRDIWAQSSPIVLDGPTPSSRNRELNGLSFPWGVKRGRFGYLGAELEV